MFTFQSTVTVFAGAYAYFTVNFNQITKKLKRKKKKKSPFVYSKKIKEQTSQNNSLNVVSARGLLKLVLQSGNNWTNNNNKSKSINQSIKLTNSKSKYIIILKFRKRNIIAHLE